MDEFLEEENLQAVQALHAAFSRRFPAANIAYFTDAVLGKIQRFLTGGRDVAQRAAAQTALVAWRTGEPDWRERILGALGSPGGFEAAIAKIAGEIRQIRERDR